MTSRNPDYADQNRDNQPADQVKQSATQVTDQARQAASQISDQAKSAAKTQVSTRKDQTAQRLDVVAGAAQDMGDRLRQSPQTSSYAQYVDKAAQQVQRLSGYLKRNDMQGIIDDAENWARRDPVLALGGAFVLGLVAARFLKSSGVQSRSASRRSPGYNPAARYTTSYQQPPRYGTTYRPEERYWNDEQAQRPANLENPPY